MTHLMIEDNLQAEIEAVRADMGRERERFSDSESWDDGLVDYAANFGDRENLVGVIAALTMAVEIKDRREA